MNQWGRRAFCLLLCMLAVFVLPAGCTHQSAPVAQGLSAAELKGQTYFYYHRLAETEQEAYSKIVRQIRSHPERIEIPPLENEALLRVFQAVSYDNPQILCMGDSCRLAKQSGKSYFVPSYRCGVEECARMTEALLEKARRVCDSVKGKTDYEKELFFHDYLIARCAYHEDTGNWQAYTAAGALLNGKAVCEGYSRAFQLLLNQEGIGNYLMTGSARDPSGRVDGHMWNLVTIDGAPYHVDVTWDDPVGSEQLAPSHVYFNLTDQRIAANHLTFQPETPGCTETAANFFVRKHLYFSQYGEEARARIVEAIGQVVSEDGWNLEFCFASRAAYEEAVSDLFAGERIYRLLERANLTGGQKLQTNTVQYQCSDEMFVINLTLEKG